MMKKQEQRSPIQNDKRKQQNGTSKSETPKKIEPQIETPPPKKQIESPKKVHNALAQIASAYSSDEDDKNNEEEWLIKTAKDRKERANENRKRKYNLGGGSYFGIGKVQKSFKAKKHALKI